MDVSKAIKDYVTKMINADGMKVMLLDEDTVRFTARQRAHSRHPIVAFTAHELRTSVGEDLRRILAWQSIRDMGRKVLGGRKVIRLSGV